MAKAKAMTESSDQLFSDFMALRGLRRIVVAQDDGFDAYQLCVRVSLIERGFIGARGKCSAGEIAEGAVRQSVLLTTTW